MKKQCEELTKTQEADILTLHQDLIKKRSPILSMQVPMRTQTGRTDLKTITLTALYEMTFAPRTPVIEGLLYSGTYLFAGSPKIGKSFLMAQIGYHVAMGIPLWDYPVRRGDVLYLALEDDYSRLQRRLNQMFGVETVDGLHFAIQSRTLEDGLVEQMEGFIKKHPDTRLIIVDTFQKVREVGNESYSYSMDYQNIAALKGVSDAHNLAIVIVHHTRKMEANDQIDMVSGTTALVGAADGTLLLKKKQRTDTEAKLLIVGRDQEDQELTLEFNRERCIWMLACAEKEPLQKPIEPIVRKIAEFMKGQTKWSGTASELLEILPDPDMKANILTRKLNVNVSVLYNEFGILVTRERSSFRREITLTRMDPEERTSADDNDDMTINDGISDSGHVMEKSSFSS